MKCKHSDLLFFVSGNLDSETFGSDLKSSVGISPGVFLTCPPPRRQPFFSVQRSTPVDHFYAFCFQKDHTSSSLFTPLFTFLISFCPSQVPSISRSSSVSRCRYGCEKLNPPPHISTPSFPPFPSHSCPRPATWRSPSLLSPTPPAQRRSSTRRL